MATAATARRYPSDLTDGQWRKLAPLLPRRRRDGRGRPPVHSKRRVVDAIPYANRSGCPWRYLPSEYPPRETVYGHFRKWTADGTVDRIHRLLRRRVRPAAGKFGQPGALIADSQSVKTTEKRGPAAATTPARR